LFIGSVAEWSIALVLKTSKGKPFVSSNLTASANKNNNLAQFLRYAKAVKASPVTDHVQGEISASAP
jgi:hypothetical protein